MVKNYFTCTRRGGVISHGRGEPPISDRSALTSILRADGYDARVSYIARLMAISARGFGDGGYLVRPAPTYP